MHWNSLGEFIAMGGYGYYVWGSYLVTAVCVVAEVILLRRANSDTHHRLKRMQEWEQKPMDAQ